MDSAFWRWSGSGCGPSECAFERRAQFAASLVQLGLCVASGAVEHGCDLLMIVALNIVKEEDMAIAWSEFVNGAVDGDAIDGACLTEVALADVSTFRFLSVCSDRLIERNNRQDPLAKVHEGAVDREAIEPCGEDRISAEGRDFAMDLKEGLLREIFSECKVVHDVHADGEDAPVVHGVKLREGFVAAGLGAQNDIGASAFWGDGQRWGSHIAGGSGPVRRDGECGAHR